MATLAKDSLRERKWLYGLARVGIKLGTDHVRQLYSRLDSPQEAFPSVHIAGTNGKGSIASFIASVLSRAGYRTGLYTSPHIVDVTERIRVDGVSIPEDDLMTLLDELRSRFTEGEISFFEATTLIAFRHFINREIDVAVVETGLGGRLDATNVVRSVLSVIAAVGVDHVKYLGSDVSRIASEKAGIIRRGNPVVTCAEGDALEVIREVADDRRSPLSVVNHTGPVQLRPSGSVFSWHQDGRDIELEIPLAGRHQVLNAAVSLESMQALRTLGWEIDDECAKSGLARAFWPGRLQALGAGPSAVLDVAHNPMGTRVTVDAIREIYPECSPNIVFGACADKDWKGMLDLLVQIAGTFVLTQSASHRSLDSNVMLRYLDGKASATAIEEPGEAVAYASALDGLMLVTGSHYLLGDVWSTLDGPSLNYLWDN